MNNNMNQRGLHKQIFAIGIIIFFTTICLGGCTDTQNTGNNLNSFIGTWAGSVKVSMFGGPMGGNSTFTELTFMQDIVIATLNNERGMNTMNYTYVVNGNKLVLDPSFFGGGTIPDRKPFNNTQPSFNNTMFPPNNGTRPFNDTQPPFNNTWPPNEQQPPSGQQSPSMSLSFLYSFDENNTVLYINGSKFIKIQYIVKT